jgi:hypothetical protein
MELQDLERPWEGLDPRVAELLAPELPAVADAIRDAVAAAIPDYTQPMQGAFGQGVRQAIEQALRGFVEQLGRPTPSERPGREAYVALGRGELRAGRPLEALQGAYRIGARVAWRHFSEVARANGRDAAELSRLAESVFAYIDEISAESVEGYAQEQEARAGERQRRRLQLVRMLLDEDHVDEAAVLAQAQAADWPLPRELAALVTDCRDAERFAARIGEGALAARIGDLVCVLVPDPRAPGRIARVERALEEPVAALGPAVAWVRARESHARALRCARLQQAGALPGGLLHASERLGVLALTADPAVLEELAQRRLAALREETPTSRERLERTLLAWLRHQGAVVAAAAELHVHAQTVRYRLARLRELLGDDLDQPDARFELELALRHRALASRSARE